MARTLNSNSSNKESTPSWSLRKVRWLVIIKHLHYGALLLFAAGALASGVAHWTMGTNVTIRPALVYDATLSYPQAHTMIISSDIATILNWICYVISVLIIEFLVFHKQHSLTAAIAAVVHHSMFCVVAFIITVAVAEMTKPTVGRLRPDFFARCHPANGIDPNSDFVTALSNHTATLKQVRFGEWAGECTSEEKIDGGVQNGRLSFVSGHASNSMCTAWYTALYMMWSLYMRVDNPYVRKLYVATSKRARIGQEILYAFAYGFILFQICLSWFIGMTRFWDNVHAVSDIMGGFLLAIIFTSPLIVMAIGLHIKMQDDIHEAERLLEPTAAASNGIDIANGNY